MNPKVIFHLGVHKTASTHLQRSFKKNQDLLDEYGFTYINPKQCREALFPITLKLRDGGDEASLQKHTEMVFHGAANGNPNLIISDENMIGHLDQLINKNLIYPWSHFRLARFFRLLPTHEFEMFVGLRNLATYLPSAYVENLLHAKYQTFESFMNHSNPWDFSWATMMRRFGNMSAGRKFNVWQYEDYGSIKSEIVSQMTTPALAHRFEFINKYPRPILSHAAVDYFAKARNSGRTERSIEILQEAGELFPIGEQHPAFQPFSQQDIEKATEKYIQDIRMIAKMDHVRLVAPTE